MPCADRRPRRQAAPGLQREHRRLLACGAPRAGPNDSREPGYVSRIRSSDASPGALLRGAASGAGARQRCRRCLAPDRGYLCGEGKRRPVGRADVYHVPLLRRACRRTRGCLALRRLDALPSGSGLAGAAPSPACAVPCQSEQSHRHTAGPGIAAQNSRGRSANTCGGRRSLLRVLACYRPALDPPLRQPGRGADVFQSRGTRRATPGLLVRQPGGDGGNAQGLLAFSGQHGRPGGGRSGNARRALRPELCAGSEPQQAGSRRGARANEDPSVSKRREFPARRFRRSRTAAAHGPRATGNPAARPVERLWARRLCAHHGGHTRANTKIDWSAQETMVRLRPQIIIFDVDGVLVDARGSYHRTIVQTVRHFTGRRVRLAEIHRWKSRPGYNDDWKLTTDWIRTLGRKVSYSEVKQQFEQFYWGSNSDGNVTLERWLAPRAWLRRWSQRAELAVFTGRTRRETQRTLEAFRVEPYFRRIVTTSEVARPKPDPEGLLRILDGREPDIAMYLGDNIDDALAAQGAGIPFVGVLPRNSSARKYRAAGLRRLGASTIIGSVLELEKVWQA